MHIKVYVARALENIVYRKKRTKKKNDNFRTIGFQCSATTNKVFKGFLVDLMHLPLSFPLSPLPPPAKKKSSSTERRAQCSFSTCINDINDPRFTGNSIGNRRFCCTLSTQ